MQTTCIGNINVYVWETVGRSEHVFRKGDHYLYSVSKAHSDTDALAHIQCQSDGWNKEKVLWSMFCPMCGPRHTRISLIKSNIGKLITNEFHEWGAKQTLWTRSWWPPYNISREASSLGFTYPWHSDKSFDVSSCLLIRGLSITGKAPNMLLL